MQIELRSTQIWCQSNLDIQQYTPSARTYSNIIFKW